MCKTFYILNKNLFILYIPFQLCMCIISLKRIKGIFTEMKKIKKIFEFLFIFHPNVCMPVLRIRTSRSPDPIWIHFFLIKIKFSDPGPDFGSESVIFLLVRFGSSQYQPGFATICTRIILYPNIHF